MKHIYRVRWGSAFCNSSSDSIFVRNLSGTDRIFFLTGNYDLTVPKGILRHI